RDFRIEADEFRELDDERVLVFAHYSGHGKTSGVEIGQVRMTAATLLQIRERKVVRLVTYWDRDGALADPGLEEEAVRQENGERLGKGIEHVIATGEPDKAVGWRSRRRPRAAHTRSPSGRARGSRGASPPGPACLGKATLPLGGLFTSALRAED